MLSLFKGSNTEIRFIKSQPLTQLIIRSRVKILQNNALQLRGIETWATFGSISNVLWNQTLAKLYSRNIKKNTTDIIARLEPFPHIFEEIFLLLIPHSYKTLDTVEEVSTTWEKMEFIGIYGRSLQSKRELNKLCPAPWRTASLKEQSQSCIPSICFKNKR